MKKVTLGVFLGVCALAAMVASLLLIAEPSKSDAGSNRIIVIDDGGSTFPTSELAMDSHGAKVVRSWSDARSAADESTKAIILTDSTLATTDDNWVRGKVHDGVVIGALDVSSEDLASAFGLYADAVGPDGASLPSPPALDASRLRDQLFFSLVIDVRTTSHVRRGGMTERFESTDQFLAHVERYIANAGAIAKE